MSKPKTFWGQGSDGKKTERGGRANRSRRLIKGGGLRLKGDACPFRSSARGDLPEVRKLRKVLGFHGEKK